MIASGKGSFKAAVTRALLALRIIRHAVMNARLYMQEISPAIHHGF
jgi:hypothetical protein